MKKLNLKLFLSILALLCFSAGIFVTQATTIRSASQRSASPIMASRDVPLGNRNYFDLAALRPGAPRHSIHGYVTTG